MTKKAIIFGSIGTIVETSDMQRAAFNRAFAEAGLDWDWTRDIYAPMLRQSGGRQRISDYADRMGVEVNATALHDRKTKIFGEMMTTDDLAPRSGVLPLIRFAKDNDLKVGFATSTSRNNIDAIFEALQGALHRSTFDFVGDEDSVTASKPDPEIYNRTMSALRVDPKDCLAIEDTGISMQAALAAGITCIGFPGTFAQASEFEGAARIVDTVAPDALPFLAVDQPR